MHAKLGHTADVSWSSREPDVTRSFDGKPTALGSDSVPSFDPDRTARELPIGHVINGRYTIRAALGRGGMGHVYDVHDEVNPGRATALKVAFGLGQRWGAMKMLRSEFAIMTRLDHPHVAEVYDFEPIRGTADFLIAMERIDGESLRVTLDAPRPTPWVVARIVQVCRALSYMNSRGVAHFDLKPGNIMLTRQDVVRVVDFGISGAEPAHGDGSVVGTPRYMAPEVLLGGEVDSRADLYSLGITVYALLTGRPPCEARSLAGVAEWMRTSRVELKDPSVPRWLAAIVERLCARDPADRYPRPNAVIEALNAGGGTTFELETEQTKESYIVSPRFTGRSTEYGRLVGFMQDRFSRAQGPTVATVRGPAGIGKSRLFKELRQYAQLHTLAFFESSCYERSLDEYGPWSELLLRVVPLLESFQGIDDVERALPELVKIAPRLARGRSFSPSPPATSAEGERARLLETVAEFLVRAAERVPFALYVNDLQWAARGTAEIFAYLARKLHDSQRRACVPLALLGSFRDDEVEGRPIGKALEELQHSASRVDVELRPLAPVDVSGMVRSMLGVQQIPKAFLERVANETGGNPFFVQEVMRELFENGSVFLKGGKWSASGTISELKLPTTIADVFRRRFAHLDASARDVVRLLAVHGRPMSLALLERIVGGDGVPQVVRLLGARRLIVLHSESTVACELAHDRIRETIYGDLPPEQRSDLHGRIGTLLESQSEGLPPQARPLDDMALHFSAAGLVTKAIRYSMAAGRRALDNYANDSAVVHLEYVRAHQPSTECEELLAEALLRTGNIDRSAEVVGDAISRSAEPQARARLRGLLARCHFVRGNYARSTDEGWRAVTELGETRPRGQPGLLWSLAGAYLRYRFAMDLERDDLPTGDRDRLITRLYAALAECVLWSGGDPREFFLVAMRAALVSSRLGPCEERAIARAGLAGALAWLGEADYSRWKDAAQRDLRRRPSLETEVLISIADNGSIGGAIASSPEIFDEIRSDLRKALASGTRFLPTMLSCFLRECWRTARWEEGHREYERLVELLDRAAPSFLEDGYAELHAPRIVLHHTGSVDLAREISDRVLLQARAKGNKNVQMASLAFAAEISASEGDTQRAIEELEAARSMARRSRSVTTLGFVGHQLPRLYLRADEGSRHPQRRAEHAIADNRRLIVRRGRDELRPLTLLAEGLLAESLGDTRIADAKLAEARSVAKQMYLAFYKYEIVTERARLRAARGDTVGARHDFDDALRHAVDSEDLLLRSRCRLGLADLD